MISSDARPKSWIIAKALPTTPSTTAMTQIHDSKTIESADGAISAWSHRSSSCRPCHRLVRHPACQYSILEARCLHGYQPRPMPPPRTWARSRTSWPSRSSAACLRMPGRSWHQSQRTPGACIHAAPGHSPDAQRCSRVLAQHPSERQILPTLWAGPPRNCCSSTGNRTAGREYIQMSYRIPGPSSSRLWQGLAPPSRIHVDALLFRRRGVRTVAAGVDVSVCSSPLEFSFFRMVSNSISAANQSARLSSPRKPRCSAR